MAEVLVYDLEVPRKSQEPSKSLVDMFRAAGIALLSVQVLAGVVAVLEDERTEIESVEDDADKYVEVIFNRPPAY